MQPETINKQVIIRLLLVFFVLAPVLAWFVSPHSAAGDDRTIQQFNTFIQDYNKEESVDQQIPPVTIKSVQRVQDVWYILTVTSKDTEGSSKMLIADFYHDPKSMRLMSLPFEVALQKNISGTGVPYSVLKELNPELEGSSNE